MCRCARARDVLCANLRKEIFNYCIFKEIKISRDKKRTIYVYKISLYIKIFLFLINVFCICNLIDMLYLALLCNNNIILIILNITNI